jgi:hypothetical protein
VVLALLAAAPCVGEGQRIAPVAAVALRTASEVPTLASADGPALASVALRADVTPRQRRRRLIWGLASGAAIGTAFAYWLASSPLAAPGEGPRIYAFFVPGTTLGIATLSWFGMWPCPGDCGDPAG